MDLTTSYLGLTLASPLVASASPVSQRVEDLQVLERSGVGAVVLYSLFEEQIRRQQLADHLVTDQHEEAFGEASSFLPSAPTTAFGGAVPYLEHLASIFRPAG
jgi:dihydroorotate dehydrogenase (fumarate)